MSHLGPCTTTVHGAERDDNPTANQPAGWKALMSPGFHLRRLDTVFRAEVAGPFVDPQTLPGCLQIDGPRAPEFFGVYWVVGTDMLATSGAPAPALQPSLSRHGPQISFVYNLPWTQPQEGLITS